MTTYATPSFPLTAKVWYNAQALPAPGAPADETIHCSLAPIPFRDYNWLPFQPSARTAVTHIIRTPMNPRMGDSFAYGLGGVPYPCTLIECPVGSDHIYVVAFGHQVGAGFSNWFTRAYVYRLPRTAPGDAPTFIGWI